ncbi:MAG TPA: IS4 family transposase [Candidatus Coprenecus avistercoris]|uniref:IS4 family transposase n=5 Tax=Bacteroidales TaxID=171549 RepID=A0A9D1J6S3_9BACT|nr:IS4 family transposase [Candidatus Coprenecus avistercoris]
MNKGKYVFSQLLDFLDKDVFLRISNKYNGNRYVKSFTCWNQLAVMMFGQLSNRESLRDLVLATQAHASKAFHLGFGKAATRSNLSKANNNRDCRIFEDFAYRVMADAQKCRAVEIFKLGGKVYAFDSTTIDLCLSVFEWALFRKKKGGIKLHTLYDIETQIPTFFHITPARQHDTKAMDVIPYEENSFYIFDRAYNDFGRLFTINGVRAYFVVRGRKNNDFRPMRWKRRLPSGVLSDAIGYMNGQLTMSKYPEKIRRIIYLDSESGRKFIFFTNALDISSLKVAELYHNRWQIELFFKWLKQHLKIKKFWGETENAVRIQIYTAITAYCMMAIVQKKMGVERSIYEMLQLVSISLTETICLKDLFAKPNCNIVNELNDSSEPTLF